MIIHDMGPYAHGLPGDKAAQVLGADKPIAGRLTDARPRHCKQKRRGTADTRFQH